MPNDDKDLWIGGDNDEEVRSDVQPKTKPKIKLLAIQVRSLDHLELSH
jgi:hypothetical protein